MRTTILALFTVALSSCGTPPDPRRTNFEIRGKDATAKYDPKTGKLQRLDADLDKNGRMESFSYWDGPRLILIEVDKNGDRRIEWWEHYGDGNKMIKVGSSTRDDGVEDSWDYPDETGNMAKVENDENRDGIVDKRCIYAAPPRQPERRVVVVAESGHRRVREAEPACPLSTRRHAGADRGRAVRRTSPNQRLHTTHYVGVAHGQSARPQSRRLRQLRDHAPAGPGPCVGTRQRLLGPRFYGAAAAKLTFKMHLVVSRPGSNASPRREMDSARP